MKKLVLAVVIILASTITNAREFKDLASARASLINRVGNDDITLELPRFVFSHTNTKISVKFKNPAHDKLVNNNYKLHFIVNGSDQVVEFDHAGAGSISCTFKADNKLSVLFEDVSFAKEVSVISIWYVVLPLAALFLFLGYRLAFSKKKFTVISNKDAEQEETSGGKKNSNLKVVREEEVLV